MRTLCKGVAKCCPNAILKFISNPMNSMVSIVMVVLKKAEVIGVDPKEVDVPAVGGHAKITILPLLSQVSPKFSFSNEEIEYLTNRFQNEGKEVVEAKAGTGSATLSMAYAQAKFVDAYIHGLRGDTGIVRCAFVASEVTELPIFVSKVRLGRSGIEEVYPLGPLSFA